MFLFIFLLQKKLKPSVSYLIVLGIAMLIGAALIYKHSALLNTLMHTDFTVADEGVDRITSFRSEIIREMLVMYHQDKMFGAGWYTPFGTFETAHNYLINIIGWTGYTGFAVISVSSLLLLIQIIRNHERIFEDQWMLCILICIWIISLLDQGILGTTNSPFVYLFYLIAGYLSSPFFKRDTLTTNQLQINS